MTLEEAKKQKKFKPKNAATLPPTLKPRGGNIPPVFVENELEENDIVTTGQEGTPNMLALVQAAMNGQPATVQDLFNTIMKAKVADALSSVKQEIAETIFNGEEDEVEENQSDDENELDAEDFEEVMEDDEEETLEEDPEPEDEDEIEFEDVEDDDEDSEEEDVVNEMIRGPSELDRLHKELGKPMLIHPKEGKERIDRIQDRIDDLENEEKKDRRRNPHKYNRPMLSVKEGMF